MFVKIAALCLLAIATTQAYPTLVSLGRGTGRIISGRDAERGEFPWQISLQWRILGSESHICGGSIINERWILTAGHCFPYTVGSYSIRAGLLKQTDVAGVQRIDIRRYIVHPGFEGGVGVNDIAVAELASPLELGDNVSPVQLPPRGVIPEGESTLSGWGLTSSWNDDLPNSLQTVDLPIITIDDCADRLASLLGSSDPLDGASNVCTAPRDNNEGACSGDSGGPLVQQGTNTQIGVVSWGITPCGTGGAPSVFTRVSAFIDWIDENIN